MSMSPLPSSQSGSPRIPRAFLAHSFLLSWLGAWIYPSSSLPALPWQHPPWAPASSLSLLSGHMILPKKPGTASHCPCYEPKMPSSCFWPSKIQLPSLTLWVPDRFPFSLPHVPDFPSDSSALLPWCLRSLPHDLVNCEPLLLHPSPGIQVSCLSIGAAEPLIQKCSQVLQGPVLGLVPWSTCEGKVYHPGTWLLTLSSASTSISLSPKNTPCWYRVLDNHSNHLHWYLTAPCPGIFPLRKVHKSPCLLFLWGPVSFQKCVHSTIERHSIVLEWENLAQVIPKMA